MMELGRITKEPLNCFLSSVSTHCGSIVQVDVRVSETHSFKDQFQDKKKTYDNIVMLRYKQF